MYDYYPFGFVMNQYLSNGEKYRFGYQGDFSEDDTEETGFNHFEAREYDSRLGRWMVMDPARQYASGYLGIGNNPISGVDPDGRYSKFGAWLRNGFSSQGLVQSDGEWGFNDSFTSNILVTTFGENGGSFTTNNRTSVAFVNYGKSGGGRHAGDYGVSVGLAGNITLGGGISFELGFIRDMSGDEAFYYDIGFSYGFDASIGVQAKKYMPTDHQKGFDIEDINGWGATHNVAAGPLDVVLNGGNLNYTNSPLYFGNKYTVHGAGLSFGSPVGYTYEVSKTKTF